MVSITGFNVFLKDYNGTLMECVVSIGSLWIIWFNPDGKESPIGFLVENPEYKTLGIQWRPLNHFPLGDGYHCRCSGI